VVLTLDLLASPAFGQGPVVRVTLDEAIQMALQYNHNLLAARTTIQQSETDQQVRFFATALGAEGSRFKSARPEPRQLRTATLQEAPSHRRVSCELG
jgi:hypothetical protein